MRHLIISLLLILITQSVHSQTFLDAYKKDKLDRADTISNSTTRKKRKKFIRAEILELDTVFQSYKNKTGFNFNTADTLFIIFDAPEQSPSIKDIIIWSGKDTISYIQGLELIKPRKYKRIITYKPFTSQVKSPKGFKIVTERDSLITLVSKRDFNTILHLGDNQTFYDGGYYLIYIVYKSNGQYKFEKCFPNKFIIREIYRKE